MPGLDGTRSAQTLNLYPRPCPRRDSIYNSLASADSFAILQWVCLRAFARKHLTHSIFHASCDPAVIYYTWWYRYTFSRSVRHMLSHVTYATRLLRLLTGFPGKPTARIVAQACPIAP